MTLPHSAAAQLPVCSGIVLQSLGMQAARNNINIVRAAALKLQPGALAAPRESCPRQCEGQGVQHRGAGRRAGMAAWCQGPAGSFRAWLWARMIVLNL